MDDELSDKQQWHSTNGAITYSASCTAIVMLLLAVVAVFAPADLTRYPLEKGNKACLSSS